MIELVQTKFIGRIGLRESYRSEMVRTNKNFEETRKLKFCFAANVSIIIPGIGAMYSRSTSKTLGEKGLQGAQGEAI